MLSGGHLKDIPLPHRRRWPGDENKRGVRFNVGVYFGIGRHYHVSFTEENNPVWNPQTNAEAEPEWGAIQNTEFGQQVIGWQSAWDDREGRGRAGGEKFSTKYKAARYIRLVMALMFPDREATVNATNLDEWLIEQEHETDPRFYYYYYRRDGD